MDSAGCCCKGTCLMLTCIKNFRKIATAMFVRILYMCYVVVVLVSKLVRLKPQFQWIDGILLLGLLLMIVEALYINIWKNGREGKWFSPSTLFFLIAVAPSIYNMRLNFPEEFEGPLVLVQGAIVVLVLGKWIAPKGNFTANEHSQLLLVLMGAGADIVDFIALESHVENAAMKNVIMAVSCWCALQFCIVATAKKELPELHTSPSSNIETHTNAAYENERQSSNESATSLHDVVIVDDDDHVAKSDFGGCNYFCFYNEIWGIILNLILFEGPFLLIRATLMAGGLVKIQSTIVFFAFKNFLAVLLSLNRIKVVVKTEYKPWKDHMDKVRKQNLPVVNKDKVDHGRNAEDDEVEMREERR